MNKIKADETGKIKMWRSVIFRCALVASALWLCIAYVTAKDKHGLNDVFFIEIAVIPLIVCWGLTWCMHGRQARRALSGSPTEPSCGAAELSLQRASSGPRWVARLFDTSFFSLVGALPIVILLDLFVPSFWAFFLRNLLWTIPVALIASCALALWVESIFYQRFQTTPGKTLLRIVVKDRNGVPLSPEAYRRRNFDLFGAGLGFGLPLLNLITYAVNGRLLSTKGYTKWDGTRGHVVVQRPLSLGGMLGFFAASLALSTAIAAFNALQGDFIRTTISGYAAGCFISPPCEWRPRQD
jgi:hypothetical protein